MIYYRDDTGFTAFGKFRADMLPHAGMVMCRTTEL
ncbi:Atu4866 domain-containing protein [Arthrobacter sp. ATA002]